MKKLSGKTALVTGAGRGIGLATAVLFAKNGANLVLISRTADELDETSNLCLAQKVDVFSATIDLADRKAMDELFNNLPEDFTKIDILINNAALFDSGLMHRYEYTAFEKMLRVNLMAPYYLAKKIIPVMIESGGGAIVNLSSFSGCFGVEKFPGFGAYNISKYGLWGLTEILALEYRRNNIRVNQISPSGVDTRMFHQAVPPGVKPELTPSEVARHILYLVSDDSAPLTGANIMLTGYTRDDGSDD